jgi:hypothetical protein
LFWDLVNLLVKFSLTSETSCGLSVEISLVTLLMYLFLDLLLN